MTTQKERWDARLKEFENENQTLEQAVKSFIQILDSKEESDSGNVFSPVTISSCRVMQSARLEILLSKFRELT